MDPRKGFLPLLLIFFLLLVISFHFPLLSLQEARRAVLVSECFLRQSLLPTYNFEPYFTKPPLHIWLSLPFYALGNLLGHEIFFLRLLSFLSYFITAYFLYLINQRDYPKTLISLLILFSSYRFFSFIYRIDLEPLFVCFTTGAFYFLTTYKENPSSKGAFFFYLFMSLAFLVRGPLNFFLFPAILIYALLTRNRNLLLLIFYIPGWILLFGISSLWFLWGYLLFGKEIFQTFLSTDIGERLFAKKDPFYYYLKAFSLNFLPYILLLLVKFKNIYLDIKNYLKYPYSLYLSLFLFPLILLSFSGEKFDKYLLFLYPIAATFFSHLLLSLYNLSFIIKVSYLCLILNVIALFLTLLSNLEDIKFKTEIMLTHLSPKENYAFYLETHPLVLYTLKRPIKVISSKEEVLNLLNQNTRILSPQELKDFTPIKVLPDPYKKSTYWYLY